MAASSPKDTPNNARSSTTCNNHKLETARMPGNRTGMLPKLNTAQQ